MKALILLGGVGTRLRPLTLHTPKPLLPILNRPFITYQLDLLKKFGVREVILALGHKAAHFRRRLGDGKKWGVRFRYSIEKTPMGTGGAIRLALGHMDGPTVILNGDALSDFDLKGLAAAHRKARSKATLALVEVENPSAFGLVQTDGHGRITGFLEKPSADQITSRTINAGCYLFEPEVVERIPAGRPVSIEREIFPALIREKVPVQGFLHRGYWSDIGTLRTYWRTHDDLHKMGRWPVRGKPRGGILAERAARVHKSVRSGGTLLVGQGAVVGPEVVAEGRVTVGPRARIGEGVRLADCVVLEGARVGARARIERAVVGPGARVGEDCRVGPDQVVGEGSLLSAHSQILPGMTEL